MPVIDLNYTYILECRDGTFYIGWTNDMTRRLASHNSGKGSKYTRSRLPVRMVYYELSDTKEQAMSREFHLKRLSRKQKCELIKGFQRHENTPDLD